MIKKSNKSNKSRKTSNRGNRISFGLNAFPNQLRNTLRYADEVTLAVSVGFGKYIFSCNGMFDPNITGVGHQPLYFDQLTAVYDHYTVYKSRIRVLVAHPASQTTAVLTSLYIDDDTSTVGDASLASERPGAKSTYNVPSVYKANTLTMSWDGIKAFGPTPMTDPNLQGTVAANPTEQQFYVIQVYDSGLNTFSAKVQVVMEFDAIWDEFVTVTNS
jgi:hypothetical protein